MKKIVFSILMFILSLVAVAQDNLRLPAIISNHAVLQQLSDVRLWGWASSSVKISCSWNSADTISARPAKDWTWSISVKTPKSGGPYAITFITEKQKIVITDILIGEVWLCSGQSNMEYAFNWQQGVLDAGDAVAQSANNQLRFFQLSHQINNFPQTNSDGEWKVSAPETVTNMSVAGYFFGKKINETTKSPVGLIASYWGGSCVQAWTPGEEFEHNADLKKSADNLSAVPWAPVAPSVIYNAMIFPLLNYKIAGTIWYQGEGNTEQPQEYGKLFNALIQGWRKSFHDEIPFYYVQIAPWNGYSGISAALLREQQETALKLPKTGMIVVGDLVDDITNIHPKIKKEVGNRLANLALKEQYGIQGLQPYFPQFSSFTVKENKINIKVTSIGKLICKGKTINSFQIAGDDKVFYPATASIEKNGSITLASKMVKSPVSARYCFTNDGMPNLFDVNGLPLEPFRTDRW